MLKSRLTAGGKFPQGPKGRQRKFMSQSFASQGHSGTVRAATGQYEYELVNFRT